MGTRILTVEDDERIRTAVKLALDDEGCTVDYAASGEDAIAAVALQAAPGESFTAEKLAERIGAAEKAELVFKVLEHLAANRSTGVKKRAKAPVVTSLYRMG